MPMRFFVIFFLLSFFFAFSSNTTGTVFVFVYKLQEEVHRYTVSQMDKAKRKTLKKSYLENIDGVGAKKAKLLMSHFKTLGAIKEASLDELLAVKTISQREAQNIIDYFKRG